MGIPSQPIDNGASNVDLQVVAGVAGKVIRVLNFVLVAGGTVTAQFASGTAGAGGQTNLTGAMPLQAANGGLWPGFVGEDFQGRACHFETKMGEGLVLKSGGNVEIAGYINYLQVAAP